MPTLEARLTKLERESKPAERVTVVRLVAVGEAAAPMTEITHSPSGKTWHILPGETERELISRAQAEINEPRMILLAG